MLDPRVRRYRFERYFALICAVFAVLMVLTNVIGAKLFHLMPNLLPSGFGFLSDHSFVVLTTGLITYPLTFLFTDICSEVWGRRRANFMVFLGFICSVLMLLVVQVAVHVPRSDRFTADAANQPVAGAQLLAAGAAGSTRLHIDDASHLLLPRDVSAGHAAIMVNGKPVFFSYTALDKPMVQQTAEDGSVSEAPQRWDNRGHLVLAEPLSTDVPAGSWVVPAVRIAQAATSDSDLRIDRPTVPTRTGTFVTASGTLLSYGPMTDSGELTPSKAWNSPSDIDQADLASGKLLAVDNRFTPFELQKNYASVFAAPGILLFSSMLAYLVAQFLDVFLFHFWKNLTRGKYLWLRNNGSTMISQLADTIIVNGIFLTVAFGMQPWDVVKVIIAVYIVKMVLAWIDTPLIYAGVWLAKKRLGYAWSEEVDIDLLDTDESGSAVPAGSVGSAV